MGNDALSHRVAIGLFYVKTNPLPVKCVYQLCFNFSEILLDMYFACKRIVCNYTEFVCCNSINLALCICIIKLCLLMLCGDIEENPGPVQGELTRTVQSSISIIHLNVRSLRNKINDITPLVEDFDIACFTETRSRRKYLYTGV